MALNRYPAWKNGLIVLIVILGIIYALPNLFGENPALQILGTRGQTIDQALVNQIDTELKDKGYAVKDITHNDKSILIRLLNADEQLPAQEDLKTLLGNNYIVALSLAPAAPQWLQNIGATPLKLGLDLRGGVHFLMEVDIESALRQRLESYQNEIRAALRKENIRYSGIELNRQNQLVIRFKDKLMEQKASDFLKREFDQLSFLPSDVATNAYALVGGFTQTAETEIRDYVMEQSMTTLRNRVNELGVSEASVERQGTQRIIVQLPGILDTARAKEIIGKTATVQFLLVDENADPYAAVRGRIPPSDKVIYDREGEPHVFHSRVILSGNQIIGATSSYDEYNRPEVNIRIGGNTRNFTKTTQENIGKAMGTIYIETRYEPKIINGEEKRVKQTVEEVISIATIQSALGNRFRITGLASPEEARNLALLLRAGALPAPIDIIEERTIGPSLGEENIKKGFLSVLVGLILLLVFMLFYYNAFGIIADIALIVNLVLLLSILSAIGATLTLPGIAGILLTLGMAVDANVLIFERIREELRNKTSPQAAIYAGFEKALSTIVDANLTTFIAAMALFSIGSGPVRGFAITLSIGLITSVFSATMVSRAIVNGFFGNRRLKKLPIGV